MSPNTASNLSTDDSDSLPTLNGGLGEMQDAANDDVTQLPDGSAFGVMSFALPQDHWIYECNDIGGAGDPPFVDLSKYNLTAEQTKQLEADLRSSVKYAVRASTRCGKAMDFDPDAMLQNFRVATFGYYPTPKLATWAEVEAAGDPDAAVDAPVLIQN